MPLATSLRFNLEEEEESVSPAFCFNLGINKSKADFFLENKNNSNTLVTTVLFTIKKGEQK